MSTEAEKRAPEASTMSLEELRPFSGNPRRITDEGLRKIQDSIERFGFVSPVIVQRRTNVIIAGHQRIKAARAAGITEVPVMIVDLDDDEMIALNIADNRLSEEADWDDPALAELFERMPADLQKITGFDPKELNKLLGLDDPDKAPPWVDRWEIVVECAGEEEQEQLYERFKSEGLTCRILSM